MIYPNDPLILTKCIVNFYSRVTNKQINDVSEIPADALTIILHMRYVDMIEYDVKQDRQKHLSLRFIATRYGVGVRVIRGIVS